MEGRNLLQEFTVYTNGKYSASGFLTEDTEEEEMRLLRLYPEQTDQRWGGFGGAVTDSAAYVWSRMAGAQRQELIDAYFSPAGLNYSLVRVPLDSCDFSLEPYEAAPDGDLARFDVSRPLRYILPMLEAIRKTRAVSLLLSPWSPPAAFKSNGARQRGGKCLPEYREAWAEYLCRYVQVFRDLGFPVFGLTLQNEPHATQPWDSCRWTAEEERAFLVDHVKPALLRHGLAEVEVYCWDHNKERVLDRSLAVLAGEGRDCAAGVAFHWYSGDHFAALRQVHRLFPEKKLLLSEHCVDRLIVAGGGQARRDKIAHELLGDIECGTSCIFDWNLLLDGQGGPNYVENYCHAPFLYQEETRTLVRQDTYEAYWHLAHFLAPGDERILSSSFSPQIEATAFRRAAGGIVLALRNSGEATALKVSLEGKLAALKVPAGALVTAVMH